ncbi:MAG: 2-C-methyl-D-erythritol 4-phosphate cytidylyltransferase [Gammaproteobacteria bacterium]
MSSNSTVWAIIPAAGIGSRMHSDTAKQYLRFQGKTIIEHCLDRLLSHPQIDGAIVVLREDDRLWDELGYNSSKPVFIANGGLERHHSVYSGLTTLQYRLGNDAIALVHDAVRPLVSHLDLTAVIDTARQHTAGAILASRVTDTLKLQADNMEIASTLSRELLWRALTPQVFHLQALLNALKQVIDQNLVITDDAQAMELMGHTPALVAGSTDNFKITTREDLALAEMVWLNQRDQQDNE